jgi:hypothetical protein
MKIRQVLLAGTAALAISLSPAAEAQLPSDPAAASEAAAGKALTPRVADFGREPVSADARYVANWIADSGDAAGEFLIVDKKNARVYVFDADSRVRGSSPVLLGSALGDESVAGIGTRPLAQVRPHERTTPAGRFVAEHGLNMREDVVWVDYESAVSMHRVITSSPRERRLERLATPTVDDNRISYGCINVPKAFYETLVRPVFATRRAIVYVLPDVRSLHDVFGRYGLGASKPAGNMVLD